MIIENIQVLRDSQAATDLSEKFDGLFPTWPTIVATVLALLILLLVLSKLLYKPIKKYVEGRRQFIQNNIDEAIKSNNDASVDREQANKELMQARIEAAEIVAQAKMAGERIKADQISQAKDDAAKLMLQAQSDIEREKAKFEAESKQAIIEVALEAAAKVAEKEVDNSTNRRIVEEFIKSK